MRSQTPIAFVRGRITSQKYARTCSFAVVVPLPVPDSPWNTISCDDTNTRMQTQNQRVDTIAMLATNASHRAHLASLARGRLPQLPQDLLHHFVCAFAHDVDARDGLHLFIAPQHQETRDAVLFARNK